MAEQVEYSSFLLCKSYSGCIEMLETIENNFLFKKTIEWESSFKKSNLTWAHIFKQSLNHFCYGVKKLIGCGYFFIGIDLTV